MHVALNIKSSPRILYVAPCSADGRHFGLRSRVRQIATGLQEMGELKLVVAGLRQDFPDMRNEEMQFPVERFVELGAVQVGDPVWRIKRVLNVRANPYGHQADQTAHAWMSEYVHNFDIVWLHHLRTPHAFNIWNWPHSVMDLDDVSSTFCASAARSANRLGHRLRSRLRAHLMQRREQRLGERFTVISVCSEQDRDYLNLPGPVHVIPNGFEHPGDTLVRQPASPPRIGFIGTFNYEPNAEAVQWFISKCWPRIRRELPDAELRIAGVNSDRHLKQVDSSIRALGYVADASAEMATWSVMIVPLRTGAGTRVKIADGFSKKVPIVATSLGVAGYAIRDGRELYVADSPDEFARACVRAIANPEASQKMAERGWDRFINEWTWDSIKPRIWAAAEDCLRRSEQTAQPCGTASPR